MKKLAYITILIMTIVILLTACADGNEAAAPEIKPEENSILPADIMGYWLHQDQILSYYLGADYTFAAYSHGANALYGTYKLDNQQIHLMYSEDNITIGSFDLAAKSLTVDSVDGTFYARAAGDMPPAIDGSGTAPDMSDWIFGEWNLVAQGIIITFFDDNVYTMSSVSGGHERGSFTFDGYDLIMTAEDGTITNGVYHVVNEELEIDGFDGNFLPIPPFVDDLGSYRPGIGEFGDYEPYYYDDYDYYEPYNYNNNYYDNYGQYIDQQSAISAIIGIWKNVDSKDRLVFDSAGNVSWHVDSYIYSGICVATNFSSYNLQIATDNYNADYDAHDNELVIDGMGTFRRDYSDYLDGYSQYHFTDYYGY